MNNFSGIIRFLIRVAALVAIALWVAVIIVMTTGGSDTLDPTGTFEAYTLALDEARYDEAYLLLEGCEQNPASSIEEVGSLLGSAGFSGTYPVIGEWMHDSGEKAIINLGPPPGLPDVQVMVKVDGEWRLQCDNN